eukprot:8022257-Alexandrium_andersonii.AAC.1
MAYDPIVTALAAVIRARAPAFVGDLTALTRGPRQTPTSLQFLFAAGHCAGLYTETYTCRWAEV